MDDYDLDLPKNEAISSIFGLFRYKNDFVVTGRYTSDKESIGMAYCSL